MRGRLYRKVAATDVIIGDVVIYEDGGTYTRIVKSVSKKTIMIEQPTGLTPKTKRVGRQNIKECWRWHKKD